MAGNKINTKAKGKEEKSKPNKGTSQTTEESEDLDYTLLRKPILTSITGFSQARKIFDFATEELKNLLSTECDLVYECKVCRNLFRSLANFISHKRVYCREQFNSSIHGHFINPSCTFKEISKIKRLEEEYQESLKVKCNQECDELDESEDRIPLTKDLTAIVEKIAISKGVEDINEEKEIVLQKIPKCSVAVFQSINVNNETHCDIRTQVNELDALLAQNKAVLQSDGKFKIQNSTGANASNAEHENVIQISDDDEDGNNLKCKICDLQFSTQKTLRFHMKYKHLESRLVYPCPDCLEIFSTSWSVYRHLFKVHRKTAAQVRRLRESIQAKAFRMNNPPAYYEKRKNNIKATAMSQKITEEERLDQENQAWMDNMEGDGEIPRCGGCGRTFERRAALAAHTHTCQPRSRALARRADTKKIEIQIRKDYNKGPAGLSIPIKATDANENKINREEDHSISKSPSIDSQQEDEIEPDAIDNSNKEGSTGSNSPIEVKEIIDKKILNNLENFVPRLPFAQQVEKNNLAALKQRLQPDTDLEKLLCKKCDVKHKHLQDLYDHMAGHYKWMRYACKLCNFKHYNFEKLPEHFKVVHKLKGDTDFYYSTVKAIDANEALELCEPIEQLCDTNENSSDSRRPSRCSSDSSRLSDESSSSSVRIEGAKKRKMNNSKHISKKKKEFVSNEESIDKKCNNILINKESINEIDHSSIPKVFEENSSDIDDIDVKKQIIEETVAITSRRPIRKRTRPKNEDFEYDLSNLLKLEAQGYRDSQSVIYTKPYQTKKKTQLEIQNIYDVANKDCCGALITLSKKSVEQSAAHMKILSFTINNAHKEQRTTNIFVRPMLPKVSRVEKTSPNKDPIDSTKEVITSNKKPEFKQSPTKDATQEDKNVNKNCDKISEDSAKSSLDETTKNDKKVVDEEKCKQTSSNTPSETKKTNLNIPKIGPIKFRPQSLDVINNPVLNKSYSEFSKVGMKTKILVIKPINRNNDGTKAVKAPLKFQTIKIKDPSKGNSSKEEKSKDQVVVVKVPKVDCAVTRPAIILPNTMDIKRNKKVETGVEQTNTHIKNEKISEEKEKERPLNIVTSSQLTESNLCDTSDISESPIDGDSPVNSTI